MKKYLIVLLAVICKLNVIVGQTQKTQVPLRYSIIKDASLEVYEPPFDVVSSYTDPTQPNYSSPEDVMLSEHAANTQEWINELYLPEDSVMAQLKPADLRQKNSANKQENYLRLIHKLTFEHEGRQTAIIKTRFVMDGKPMLLAYSVFQERNGRWYKWPSGELEEVKNVVMQFKSDVLYHLMAGENTNDNLVNELIAETRSADNNNIDFLKAYNLIIQWSESGRLNDLEKIRDPFILN